MRKDRSVVSQMIHHVVFFVRVRKLFCISYGAVNKLEGCGCSFFPLSFASSEQGWLGISIMGYGKNIGSCNAAAAELWAIFDGLLLLWSKGARHILFESDSKFDVQACTSEDESHGNYALTSCIKEILRRNWTVHVTHIYREFDSVTHLLAILARSQE
ncbi:hypothetical protein Gotri_018381 [Gossypium trilobum]|uniref:RNase H type-1 domain-containing protein n=1 Tax=Gossypium trilobum TaxID=34281 RepID=A0A7J9E9I3_9ROSI|nr:hypothetical protein [Gossypium trilobum]